LELSKSSRAAPSGLVVVYTEGKGMCVCVCVCVTVCVCRKRESAKERVSERESMRWYYCVTSRQHLSRTLLAIYL